MDDSTRLAPKAAPPEAPARTLGSEQLLAWVEDHLTALEPDLALRVLRHPHAGAEVVALIGQVPRLLATYEVSREIARHPRAPLVLATRAVTTLFWRDHLEVALDTRVAPQIRRLAEARILERLASLAVGERITLARRASPPLQAQLRRDPDLRVVRALLENPRLTEGVLLPLLIALDTRPDVLQLVAADRRWGSRVEVRRALARHPRTPPDTALNLISGLPRADQRSIANDPRLAEVVRRRARLLSGMG